MSHYHRSLKFEHGKSRKFWKITHEDGMHEYTVRFGRIGTHGQERVKEFPTSFQARSAAMTIVEQKLDKGYEDVTPKPAAVKRPPNPPRPEAYEKPSPPPTAAAGRFAFADDFQAFVKGKS
jgi:predicted DNA-binding WGR domain protein